jgi:hypothetical protein
MTGQHSLRQRYGTAVAIMWVLNSLGPVHSLTSSISQPGVGAPLLHLRHILRDLNVHEGLLCICESDRLLHCSN